MLIDIKRLREAHEMIDVGALHIGECTPEDRKAYKENGFKKIIWIVDRPSLLNETAAMIDRDPIRNLVEIVLNLEVISEDSDSPTVSKIEITAVRLNTLFSRLDALFRNEPHAFEGVNFATLRIRGAELQALNNFGEILDQLHWIHAEVNRNEGSFEGGSIRDTDYFFLQRGFFRSQTKLTSTGRGEAFYLRLPRPSLISLIYYKIKRFIQYNIYAIRKRN